MSRRLPLVGQPASRVASRGDAAVRRALRAPSLTIEALGLVQTAFVTTLLDALHAMDAAPVRALAGEARWLPPMDLITLPADVAAACEVLEAARADAPWRPLVVVGDGASAFRPTLSVRVVAPGRVGVVGDEVDLLVAAPSELLARRIAAVFSLVRHTERR